MKIKNVFLASLLTGLGHTVKAELIVDDVNGLSITFPDITAASEIALGVAVDVPDGTYVVSNDPDTITMVVLAGVITDLTIEPAVAAVVEAELGAETQTVLTAIVEAIAANKTAHGLEVAELKKQHGIVANELKDLKISLKHKVEGQGGDAAAAAAAKGQNSNQFNIV